MSTVMDGGDAAQDGAESNELAVQLNALTDNTAYRAVQAAYAVAVAALIDGGFSGDWVRYSYISESTEGSLRQAAYVIGGVHLLAACASAYIASSKGGNAAVAFAGGAATGVLELLRTLGLLNTDQKEQLQKTRQTADELKMPALQMEISSLDIGARTSPAGVMLSTSIRAAAGAELGMRTILEELASATKAEQGSVVYTMAVNQDPQDRQNFFMLQRFPSLNAMSQHQTSKAFKAFTAKAEPLIEEPMGLYLVNERSGKMTEPVYPFGPGGEGGRDDAVYSSPANLQGSQARGRVETE